MARCWSASCRRPRPWSWPKAVSDAEETPVSLGYDRVRFLAPVYFGDTLTVDYTISAVDVERRRSTGDIAIKNQDGTLVAVGTHIIKWVPNQ